MRKKYITIIIAITILIIFSLSATYAFLVLNESDDTATGTGGCFLVNYSGQQITSSSISASASSEGGASSDIVLSRNANCKIYTEANIYIHTNEETTAPIETVHALKYKIVVASGDGRIIDPITKQQVTQKEGVITVKNGDTLLANVSLTNTNTTYKVYLWIDPTISIGYFDATVYSGYFYATSIQTSTVQ